MKLSEAFWDVFYVLRVVQKRFTGYDWFLTTTWPITLNKSLLPSRPLFTARAGEQADAKEERCKQTCEHCSNKHYLHFFAENNAWQHTATTAAFMESSRIELRPLWEVAERTRQSGMRRTIFIVASFLILLWKTRARTPQGRCQQRNNHTRTPRPRRPSKHIRGALS